MNQTEIHAMKNFSLTLESSRRAEMIDITARVRKGIAEALAEDGTKDGLCLIHVPHTTAGVTINENADPDVAADIISAWDRMVPWQNGYRHMEGNSAAHIKASLMGSSVNIAVTGGRPALGTWQGIFFCEFDGPRTRKVNVHIKTGGEQTHARKIRNR